MSWSDRRRVLRLLAGLPALAALAGCDFQPVYATGGRGSALSNNVLVEPGEDAFGFALTRSLEDRLGPPVDAAFILSYDLEIDLEGIAITASQDTNRFNVIGTADWQLRDAATGAVRQSGRSSSFTSYSAAGTTIATRTAERDAMLRLTQILSDKIMADLLTGATA